MTLFNPLTTNDDHRHHRKLATCYQLAQSVLKVSSVLAERVGQGKMGGGTALGGSAWWLLQLKRPGQHWMAQSAFLYKQV